MLPLRPNPVVVRRRIGFTADSRAVLECATDIPPTLAEFGVALNRSMSETEWCGIPIPLPGLGLVLEERSPWRKKILELQEIIYADSPPGLAADESKDLDEAGLDDFTGVEIVNRWHGRSRDGVAGHIVIWRYRDGRTDWTVIPDAPIRNRMLLGPLETFTAWHLETERTAMATLQTLLSPRMYAAYELTGGFLETSKRSGLTYYFRRCRPTIAMTPRGGRRGDDGQMSILACLCLHPIGYYAGTFAGAMVPTDDVIAHLLMMRGDEHLYWRRANQHAPSSPHSGL